MIGKIRQLIDTGMSMYLVITLALFALFGVAFTASLLGALPFRPLDIVVCLSLFMGISLGASYVFAYLFGVNAHHKSSLITGGILFCIFSPVMTPSNLVLYGLIAVVAIASKYILVWRGRHIFNPAAIAAVLVLLTGLQAASWWIADGLLAIPVILLAFVVLYKTERLQFAGVFLLVYIATLAGSAIFNGQPVIGTVAASFITWFPLFFVGFMLSEPQTLPARHSQYLIVSGLVAVLIAVHPAIGGFYLTPEVALVIGNIVGFVMTRRVGVHLTLKQRKKFAGDQEMFEFTPRRALKFQAGQYLELTLPHAKTDLRGERRMFTIASAPESKTVRIATRYAEKSSTFKQKLQNLSEGDVLSAVAIRGDFLLPKDSSEKLLFIAGGIGITPFRAQLESLQRRGESRDIVLLYSVRNMDEVLFKDILLADTSVKVIIMAPDAKKDAKATIRGKIITPEILKDVVPDIAQRTVYISGSPAMVGSVQVIASQLGATRVQTDSFMGY